MLSTTTDPSTLLSSARCDVFDADTTIARESPRDDDVTDTCFFTCCCCISVTTFLYAGTCCCVFCDVTLACCCRCLLASSTLFWRCDVTLWRGGQRKKTEVLEQMVEFHEFLRVRWRLDNNSKFSNQVNTTSWLGVVHVLQS